MVNILLERFNKAGTAIDIRYTTNVFDNFSISLRTPVSPLPLPEETDDDNVLVKIEGNSSIYKFGWTIKPEVTTMVTTDTSAVIPATVKTVFEQILFFMNVFQPRSIDDKFRIKVVDANTPISKEGFFTEFTFTIQNGTPVTAKANCQFIVGDVVTVFEADAPSPPTAVTAVAGASSGQLQVNWVAPAAIGGSAITDYTVKYRQPLDDEWTDTTVGGVSTSKTISSLVAGGAYQVRVRAENTQGLGLPSNPIVEGKAKV